MTIDKLLTYSGGGLFVLLTLIQLAPIQVNPWSWLAKAIGKAMGIAAIEKKLDEHIATDDKRDADSHQVWPSRSAAPDLPAGEICGGGVYLFAGVLQGKGAVPHQ